MRIRLVLMVVARKLKMQPGEIRNQSIHRDIWVPTKPAAEQRAAAFVRRMRTCGGGGGALGHWWRCVRCGVVWCVCMCMRRVVHKQGGGAV